MAENAAEASAASQDASAETGKSPPVKPTKKALRAVLYSQNCNQQCQEKAAAGCVEEAEAWMNKMLSSGSDPQLESLKELLRLWTAKGMLTKMEEWFAKAASPALYPEMNMLRLDAACYNIIAKAFAEAGDIVKAEQYAREMQGLGFQIGQQCYTALVRCCLRDKDPRRAHFWCLDMIEGAGFKKPNKAILHDMIRQLADQGNVASANKWLGYMFDNNIKADEDTYDYVRRVCPNVIIPTQLSGETSRPIPALIMPVALNGEGIVRRELKEKVWAGPKHTPRPHLSSLSERERRRARPLMSPSSKPLSGVASNSVARWTHPEKTGQLSSVNPGRQKSPDMAAHAVENWLASTL